MKKRLFVLLLALLCLSVLPGCRAEWSWSFGGKKALSAGSAGLSETEVRIIALEYKCLFESYYKSLLGDRFWDRPVSDNETYEDYVKSEYILEEARALLYLNEVAKEKKIALSDAETETLRQGASRYYLSLTQDEIDYIKASEENVFEVLKRYALAEKAVTQLIADQKLEVSDEESRVMDVMMIRVLDREFAEDLHERIENGENFATIARSCSLDTVIEYSFARSELVDEMRGILFSLKDGEISDVIAYKGNYYIFRNVSSYNLILSNKEKGNLLAARRYESWESRFRAFAEENEEKISFSFWNGLSLGVSGDFPYTVSLFSCMSE